jgi:hypothetical protein
MGRMKDGNKKVRWILIEAANTASKTDDGLMLSILPVPNLGKIP